MEGGAWVNAQCTASSRISGITLVTLYFIWTILGDHNGIATVAGVSPEIAASMPHGLSSMPRPEHL